MDEKLNEIAWELAKCFEIPNDQKWDELWNKGKELGFTYSEIANALDKAIASRMN